jgi:hypothetical protein
MTAATPDSASAVQLMLPTPSSDKVQTTNQTITSSKATLPKLTGCLIKQGSFFQTWKIRYFVLDDRMLTYYSTQEDHENGAKYLGQPFKIYNEDDAQTIITSNGFVSTNVVLSLR